MAVPSVRGPGGGYDGGYDGRRRSLGPERVSPVRNHMSQTFDVVLKAEQQRLVDSLSPTTARAGSPPITVYAHTPPRSLRAPSHSLSPQGYPQGSLSPQYRERRHVHRKASGDGVVTFSWQREEKGESMPRGEHTGGSQDAEKILMKRIVEMRAELGRLQRENAGYTAAHQLERRFYAHEGPVVQTNSEGVKHKYEWHGVGRDVPTHSELVDQPRDRTVEGGAEHRKRWAERERQLLQETEYLHNCLAKEREIKAARSGPDRKARSGVDLVGTGWDRYRSEDSKEMIVLLSIIVDMGSSRRQRFSRIRAEGAAAEGSFLAACREDLAEAFNHPLDLTHLDEYREIERSSPRIHRAVCNLYCQKADAASVKRRCDTILQTTPPSRLKRASRVFRDVTGVDSPCEVVVNRSWVGAPFPAAGHTEGYTGVLRGSQASDTVIMEVGTPYDEFRTDTFARGIAQELSVSTDNIDVRNVRASPTYEGATQLELRFVRMQTNANYLADTLVCRSRDRKDPLHRATGNVVHARRVRQSAASPRGSPPSSPSSSSSPASRRTPRSRRRASSLSSRSSRSPTPPRRSRRSSVSSSPSPRRSRRRSSSSPSRRRYRSSSSSSPRRRRRRTDEGSRSRRRRREDGQGRRHRWGAASPETTNYVKHPGAPPPLQPKQHSPSPSHGDNMSYPISPSAQLLSSGRKSGQEHDAPLTDVPSPATKQQWQSPDTVTSPMKHPGFYAPHQGSLSPPASSAYSPVKRPPAASPSLKHPSRASIPRPKMPPDSLGPHPLPPDKPAVKTAGPSAWAPGASQAPLAKFPYKGGVRSSPLPPPLSGGLSAGGTP